MTHNTKVTFKKHPARTGLSAVGYSKQSVDLKIKKQTFGIIHAPTWETTDGMWHISIMIEKDDLLEDNNPNCSWRHIKFKARFANVEDAKEWIQNRINYIMNKYTLHFEEK